MRMFENIVNSVKCSALKVIHLCMNDKYADFYQVINNFFCSYRKQKLWTKGQSYNQSEHVIDANN